MNLHDDWLLEHCSSKRRNWTLGMYATHLATGSTLRCQSIKSGTILAYLRDIAKFLTLFIKADARKQNNLDAKLAAVVMAVPDEIKQLEKMRDLREPFTWDMWEYLDNLACDQEHQDSLLPSLCSWFGSGLYGGYCLSKWAQHDGHAALNHPLLDEGGFPLAFCLEDLEFRGDHNRRMSLQEAYATNPSELDTGIVRYSHQKNGDHGEKRKFKRNRKRPDRCCVVFLHQSLCRYVRLVGWIYSQPLSVYRAQDGTVKNITARDITAVMRRVASELFKMDPVRDKEDLQKWSSHSLRVGACVILHTMGFSGPQIQFILRWKSEAFMAYLRNLAALSELQNQAIADLSHQPHTI